MNNLFEFDKKQKKAKLLIGTDEAGRGPGAGAVFAAAVCFKCADKNLIAQLSSLNDSKKLTEKKREELFEIIIKNCIFSVQKSSVEKIEEINILNASLDAMNRACQDVINQLNTNEIEVFVDGNKKIKNFAPPQTCVIKGDSKSASIAAASILAKVSRDREMYALHKKFPQYCWNKNKGYLTKEHTNAIIKHGACPHHRKKFLRKIETAAMPGYRVNS